ncbi:unnamed protein product [Closterium sp. NIES-53]
MFTFSSAVAFALITELVDFAVACHLSELLAALLLFLRLCSCPHDSADFCVVLPFPHRAVLPPCSSCVEQPFFRLPCCLHALQCTLCTLLSYGTSVVLVLHCSPGRGFAGQRNSVTRLDYFASLVSESDYPLSVEGKLALGCDVLEDRQFELECLAAAVPHLTAMMPDPEGDPDALDISTLRSYAEAVTGTYVDAFSPPETNIVDGMWIFRVKRPPGSPSVFKACYFARILSASGGRLVTYLLAVRI